MTKFQTNKAFLYLKKSSANRKARQIRKAGHRARVGRASAVTRKRSPRCQWVVFRGQEKKR